MNTASTDLPITIRAVLDMARERTVYQDSIADIMHAQSYILNQELRDARGVGKLHPEWRVIASMSAHVEWRCVLASIIAYSFFCNHVARYDKRYTPHRVTGTGGISMLFLGLPDDVLVAHEVYRAAQYSMVQQGKRYLQTLTRYHYSAPDKHGHHKQAWFSYTGMWLDTLWTRLSTQSEAAGWLGGIVIPHRAVTDVWQTVQTAPGTHARRGAIT